MIKTEIKQTTVATTTWRLELGEDEIRDLLVSAGILPRGTTVELSYYDSEIYVEPLHSGIIVNATSPEQKIDTSLGRVDDTPPCYHDYKFSLEGDRGGAACPFKETCTPF